MGNMKRMQEHDEAVQSIAEELLVKAGYFERCRHEVLINDEPYDENKRHAMALATNYAKAEKDYSQAELTAAVAAAIDENGYCDECADHGD
ncbi:hypothetical protein V7798_22810 [Rhizobium laguerreae]